MDKVNIRRGLGDDVEYIAKKFRLDKTARRFSSFLGEDDCGCEGRKEKLNKFPSILKHIK